jgi:ABC-type transport system involved in cytochrome c biogenesis permease component
VWLIPLLGLVFYLPNIYATVRVTLDTPATAPWYGNLIGIVALLAGYALCPTAGTLRRESSG